ncbi:MAG: biotin/lipoyl-binding protein [Rubrivivax sp.]
MRCDRRCSASATGSRPATAPHRPHGAPGRLLRVDVEVGAAVKAGQVLGEMDLVDSDDRLRLAAGAARARRGRADRRDGPARPREHPGQAL